MEEFEIEDGVLLKYKGSDSSVILPDNITEIGEYAFYENERLESVTMPPQITKIRDSAFASCENLKNVNFSQNLEEIEPEAFWGCTALKSLELPNSLKTVGADSFYECAVTELVIPDSVEEIGGEAFSGCNELTKVLIGKNVKSMGGAPFGYNKKLAEINIHPQNGNFKFTGGCLIDVNKKSVLQTLEQFEIPSDGSVTMLNDGALAGNEKITSFEIPEFITKIDSGNAFADCSNLRKITVAKTNKRYFSQNDCVIDKTDGTLVFGLNPENLPDTDCIKIIGMHSLPNSDNVTRLKIPRGVEEICDFVFLHAEELRSVELPDTLKVIGDNAFCHCAKLEEINLGRGLRVIGEWAFSDCKSLKEIEFPESLEKIGAYAFDCVPLEKAKFLAPKGWFMYVYKNAPAKVKFKNPKKAAAFLTDTRRETHFERPQEK